MPPPGHRHTSRSWHGPSLCEAPGAPLHRHSLVHTPLNTFKCPLRYPRPLRAGNLRQHMPLRPLASVPSPLQPHSGLVTQDSGEVSKRSVRPQVRTGGWGQSKVARAPVGKSRKAPPASSSGPTQPQGKPGPPPPLQTQAEPPVQGQLSLPLLPSLLWSPALPISFLPLRDRFLHQLSEGWAAVPSGPPLSVPATRPEASHLPEGLHTN